MEGPFQSWFDAAAMYRGGVPEVVGTALQAFPNLHADVVDLVRAAAPRSALEVGPGTRPVLQHVRRAVYLDVAPCFLARLAGAGVQGDLLRAPFRSDAFDLVVANDVFTHIREAQRPEALAELARLAPRVVIFNPEPGTPEVEGSAVPSGALIEGLRVRGFTVTRRDYRAHVPACPEFTMSLLDAVRANAR